MGYVQLAYQDRLRTYFAVKRINPELLDNESVVDRFLTEARTTAQVVHNYVVRVLDIDEDADGPYIRMEFVPGPHPAPEGSDWPRELPNPPLDLEQCVKRFGPLSADAALVLAVQLCSAVETAHKRDIIHRDIKPANILLNDKLEPKLIDFGLARQASESELGATMPGARLLTLGYGAPEQEIDASTVDGRADVYAVGATLYFAITGHSPRHFRESDLPEALRPIVAKAMTRDRERRYQTIGELEADLDVARKRLAMSDGRPAQPAKPGAAVLATGVCYACGHMHGGDADARKFCASCGAALQTPCLKCQSPNPIWARFCGQCAVDLFGTVKQRQEEFVAIQRDMPALLEQYNIDDAKANAGRILETVDPRFDEAREWAREQREGPIKLCEGQARAMLQNVINRVDVMSQNQLYDEAVEVIDKLHPALRENLTRPTIARNGGLRVLDLRQRMSGAANRVRELVQQINDLIAADKHEEVADPAKELEALRKGHVDAARAREYALRRAKEIEADDFARAMGSRNPDDSRRYISFYKDRLGLARPRMEQVRDHHLRVLRPAAHRAGFRNRELQEEYLRERSPAQAGSDRNRAIKLLFFVMLIHAVLFGGPIAYIAAGLSSLDVAWKWAAVVSILLFIKHARRTAPKHSGGVVALKIGVFLIAPLCVAQYLSQGGERDFDPAVALEGLYVGVGIVFAVNVLLMLITGLGKRVAARPPRPMFAQFCSLLVFGKT